MDVLKINYLTLLEASGTEAESIIEVLRVGTIQDRGLKITPKMLEQYVQNFKDNVYGDVDEAGNPELPVNLEHNRGSAAAGWIKDLLIDPVDGDRLMARVKWTKLGIENIKARLFKFVSAELFSIHPHHETGELINNVFVGLALTNTPALKSQQPLVLSEAVNKLFNNTRMFKKMLSELKSRSYVTKEEKALLKTVLEEVSAEEKTETAADVAEVEAKPEEKPKTPEEVAAEEEAKKKADEEAQKKEQEQLSEKNLLSETQTKLKEAEEALQKFKAQEEATKLETSVGMVMLSEKQATGFVAEDKEKVQKFVQSLSQEQREEFAKLIPTVKTVDFATRGGEGAKVEDKDDDSMEETAKKEAKEMAEKEKIPYHDALAKVYAKMGSKK